MKLAFISDIHGNATALDAVLEDIRSSGADEIYVLGDLCYRGPEPKRSLELVRALETGVIKGNADEWTVRGVRPGEVPEHAVDLMNVERQWIASKLSTEDLEFLAGLPAELQLSREGVEIRAFHATPDSLFEIVPPGTEDDVLQAKLMHSAEADVYVYAHIHKPYIRYLGGRVIVNTGSVGLPFDGLPEASYAVVEVGRGGICASIRRVPYDIEAVVRQYEESGYPNKETMTRIVRSGRFA
ncbi:metallophosphoesterase family protein [Paenibacillus caseinilyticus]|nr:metallophosphoesterase family protein [Paenibacillus mucilaginosus]AFH63747.1 phosphodiesterase [Paenibacillus mucilaginosus K02]WFA19958.1 metallophosphoesterase [Paenibacillus mucilaginosus]